MAQLRFHGVTAGNPQWLIFSSSQLICDYAQFWCVAYRHRQLTHDRQSTDGLFGCEELNTEIRTQFELGYINAVAGDFLSTARSCIMLNRKATELSDASLASEAPLPSVH